MMHLLEAAFKKRKPLHNVTDAMRLVNGIGDDCEGLILEQYGHHVCAQVFNAKWNKHAKALLEILKANFEVDYFILKDRTLSSAASPDAIRYEIVLDQGVGSKCMVHEHGVKFAVDLNDGLNTGLFLDMRANRHMVGCSAHNKRMLNCFAYTCSFGLHARTQGAKGVVNVDISKKILDRGIANYQLNGFSYDDGEFIRADAGAYLQRAVKKNNRFDVIVIDPPSFARSDEGVFKIRKGLPQMINDAFQILNPQGSIFIATNFNGITLKDLKEMLAGHKTRKLIPVGQDIDFPGTNTFKESYLVGVWALT